MTRADYIMLFFVFVATHALFGWCGFYLGVHRTLDEVYQQELQAPALVIDGRWPVVCVSGRMSE